MNAINSPTLIVTDTEVVRFQHKLFTADKSAYFKLSEHTGEPVLVVSIGGIEAVLPFRGIRRELALAENSPDGLMLEMVGDGLAYVSALRVGDPVPSEVLTGEPSWETSEEHRQIAYSRMAMHLVSWLAGDGPKAARPADLLAMASDPVFKERVNEAFTEAAERIGLERREDVIDRIEVLAEKLAHIEALRGKFHDIEEMAAKIHTIRRLYALELRILEIADPVARLIATAVKEFAGRFDEIDARTSEIAAMLKRIDAVDNFIQTRRNELYRRLLAWDGMLVAWKAAPEKRTIVNEDLLRETYRFLAPRFMAVDEWVLVTKVLESTGRPKTEVRW